MNSFARTSEAHSGRKRRLRRCPQRTCRSPQYCTLHCRSQQSQAGLRMNRQQCTANLSGSGLSRNIVTCTLVHTCAGCRPESRT